MVDLKKYTQNISGKDYLTVAGRVMWFRSDFPVTGEIKASIETEIISMQPITIKAYIVIDGVLVATAFASDNGNRGKQAKGRVLEVIETSAIGRALGRAGYGIDDENEEDYLSDAPREPSAQPPRQQIADGTQDEGMLLHITKHNKGDNTWMTAHLAGGIKANFWSWSETFGLAGYDATIHFEKHEDGKITPNLKINVKVIAGAKGYWNISEITPLEGD